MPLEPIWSFYPRYWYETAARNLRLGRLWLRFNSIRPRVEADPDKMRYIDQAMTPVVDDEVDELELFTHNEGARSAVRHAKHVHDLTHASEAAE
jgi:hypothetical protein